jgi:hypothetical protein
VRSHHPTRRLGKRLAVAAIAVGATIGVTVLPAGALPEPVSAAVTGNFTTNAGPLPLTGTVFQGTWDGDTGALEGGFVFPATSFDTAEPLPPATVNLQLSQPDPGSGTVDLVTNEATYSGTLRLAIISIATPDVPSPEAVTNCTYLLPITMTGTFDPVTGILSITDADITTSVNPADAAPRCYWDGLGAPIDAIIDPVVVGAGSSFTANFNVQDASAEPPAEACIYNIDIPADDPACVAPEDPPAEEPPAAQPAAAAPQFAG